MTDTNVIQDRLYILAFGAHADDTDIGCSGTLASHALRGRAAGVCDLTHAELSSNGTVFVRQAESRVAAKALGLSMRMSLGLPDRGLTVRADYISQLVDVIRRVRPTYVLAPDWDDRHPDHRTCAAMVEEAVFSAALRRYGSASGLPAHRVRQVFYYFINGMDRPDLSVDISAVIEQKREALKAYGSQFDATPGTHATPLNQGFVDAIIGRDALIGHQIGVSYAEGFRTKRPLLVNGFEAFDGN